MPFCCEFFPSPQIDEQIENMFASKKRVKDVTEDELPVKAQNTAQAGAEPVQVANVNKANLELAKKLASRINQSLESGRQTNVVQQATQALMKGDPSAKTRYRWVVIHQLQLDQFFVVFPKVRSLPICIYTVEPLTTGQQHTQLRLNQH